MDKTEALFVEVGHQMLLRNDWVTPWWNGERFFDYPVWGYWMVALSFRLFGVSEWAARLPVALAASAVVVAVFAVLVRWGGREEPVRSRLGRAAVAAGVLATSPGWLGWGRTSTTDMFLSSAISLALLAFLLAHHAPPRSAEAALGRVGLALFSGIAVLAKGPVGLLLPLLVVGAFLVCTGQWRPWSHPVRLAAMGALFLGVCLPWYVAAARANGAAFLGGFLAFSNVQRFTQVIYDHPGPPWFYLPWLVILLFPWSLFLPGALVALRFWRLDRWRPASDPPSPGATVGLFLLLWLAVPLAFFSIAATKLPGYILPIIPAGALLAALSFWPLPAADPRPLERWQRREAGLEAGLLGAMAVAATLAPRWVATDPAHPTFAATLQRSGLPALLAGLLALTALALVLALVRGRDGRWLWLATQAGFLAILALVVAPLAPLMDRERLWPVRELARQAKAMARADEPLWVVGTKRYSTLFYGGETAAFVSSRGSLEDRLEDDPASLGVTGSSQTARLFGDRRQLEALRWPAGGVRRLARMGEQEVWRVRLPKASGEAPL
ncbi:MAG: glycosyltransferase family 39 protein [Cyanobacteriota bacterium]|nr:glycosyltransferase family 39 protein [Cyanobacteriota bacterium]